MNKLNWGDYLVWMIIAEWMENVKRKKSEEKVRETKGETIEDLGWVKG